MKKALLKLLTLAACLHGLAWTSVNQRREVAQPRVVTNGYEMVAAFSPEFAEHVPAEYAQAPIKNLKVSPHKVYFEIKGFPMFVEWIGKPGRLLKFNNRIFIAKDFVSEKAFKKAFLAKFGIQNISQRAFVYARSFANIDDSLFSDATSSVAAEEEDEDEEESRVGFVFEDIEGEPGFTRFLQSPNLYTDDALLGQTQAGRRMEAAMGLTTGGSLMSMIKFAMVFQGGINCGLTQGANCTPGFGLMNDLGGTAPGDIPLPHRTMNN